MYFVIGTIRHLVNAHSKCGFHTRPSPDSLWSHALRPNEVRELSYIHSRDVTFAVFCQGPYEESARYRDFMGWEMPNYEGVVQG